MNEQTRQTLTVTQLNRQIRVMLEEGVGLISVQGEVSNLSRPASGHAYFSLKDTSSQLRCVFFKNRYRKGLEDILKNGQALTLTGVLSLYEARGDYQLIVEHMTSIGVGSLAQQFEVLKEKLKSLGLFEPIRKKKWPVFSNAIGIITSPTGAAIKDILTTLSRRFPLAAVYIYPSEVQGTQAPNQLIQAIKQANAEARCDVLLLARGGGSLEDLWAFNDEALAFAIAESQIPIISGVGHETDFTIADFVADFRAATPTAAAEAATPDQFQLRDHCQRLIVRLNIAISRLLIHQTDRLHRLLDRLKSPQATLQSQWQTLDYLTRQLYTLMQHLLSEKKHLLAQGMQMLHTLSPLATLSRGYAIASLHAKVITQAKAAPIGSIIDVQLAEGRLHCEVLKHG